MKKKLALGVLFTIPFLCFCTNKSEEKISKMIIIPTSEFLERNSFSSENITSNGQVSFGMRFYSYDRFNKTYGYIPLLTEFSSIVPFPESLLNSLNTQIILGKQYVIEYKKDGSIISFKENSDHFLLSVLSVSDKTDEAAEWTGAVPVREENDVFYDENDDIISTQVMQDFFTYQMEKLYPFKFNCLGSLSKSGLIEGTSIPELYYYRFRLNYLISSSEGLLTSIDNLAPGSNIYISHLPNGVPCGYTFNPYEENFSTNILNVDNYNISDLATLGGGIINV